VEVEVSPQFRDGAALNLFIEFGQLTGSGHLAVTEDLVEIGQGVHQAVW
jgi:hypothetical protein